MRVPLTVNDFLYRAEAVSAYAAAVVDEPVQPQPRCGPRPTPSCSLASAGGHFLRRASPKVMTVRGWLAEPRPERRGRQHRGRVRRGPLLGCSVGCSGAARRSSRRAVALRTVSAHSPSDSGPVARRASPAARPREHAGVLSSTLCADRAVSTPLAARVAAQDVVPRPGAGWPAAPPGRGRCRSVRAGRPGREGVRPGGSR